jgi:hypothetical protein
MCLWPGLIVDTRYEKNVHPGQFPPHKQEKYFKQTQQNLNIQTNYKTRDHVRS